MGFDEAVEMLKTRDPQLVVQLAELCAAVDAAKAANDPTPAWNRDGSGDRRSSEIHGS